MTVTVHIKNEGPHDVRVRSIHISGKEGGYQHHPSQSPTILKPEEEKEFYLYDKCNLCIEEKDGDL